MSFTIPVLYHWSPARCRSNIRKRGLRPSTETAVWVRPDRPGETMGHSHRDLPEETILTVCFGTTPLTAWAYSGAHSAERGEVWDLWSMAVDADDEVHYRPHFGDLLDEVRIANHIPPGRLWFVGSRLMGRLRMTADHTATIGPREVTSG